MRSGQGIRVRMQRRQIRSRVSIGPLHTDTTCESARGSADFVIGPPSRACSLVTDDDLKTDPSQALTRPGDNARRFGDEEVQRILEAAADLQARASALGTGSARGLTIQELRQVAAEAGIDPHFVDVAATDVDAPMEEGGGSWMGGPDRWHFRNTLPGEIEDEDKDRILMALRSLMGHRGTIEEVFGRMEWSMNDGMGPVTVGVSSRDGQTEVDMSVNRSSEPGLIFGLGVPLGGFLIGILTAAALDVSGVAAGGLIAAGMAAAVPPSRWFWGWRSKNIEARLRKTMERVSSIIQEAARVAPPDEAPRLPAPHEDA